MIYSGQGRRSYPQTPWGAYAALACLCIAAVLRVVAHFIK